MDLETSKILKGYTDKGKRKNGLKRALKRKETKMLEFQKKKPKFDSRKE